MFAVFSYFIKDLRQGNRSVPIRAYYVSILKSNGSPMQSFTEEKSSHFFKRFVNEQTPWFGSLWNTQTVDCCLVSGSYEYIHYRSSLTILYTLAEALPLSF